MAPGGPPFRADHVGSLLRPERLRQARAGLARGEVSARALREIEDEEIGAAVRRQEALGLKAATDGEFRRAWWHFDFLSWLEGVELFAEEGLSAKIAVTGRLGFPASHPMLEHFAFLKRVATVLPKLTIPSPSVLHFRTGRRSISPEVYPELDAFFADAATAYADAIRAFYEAGCRYLQFDDTVWGFLCSERERAASARRGDDPDALPALYADTINRALAAKPADMTVTVHVCRGNYRSSWIAEGDYEPVAEILLGALAVDGYFLEYDTPRAGGFAPLRHLPRGDKRVVLGLLTSKSGALEDTDALRRRIDEAAAYADLDQLCLSPQCGFASTQEGNLLAEAEQWRKLERVVEVARAVWGAV